MLKQQIQNDATLAMKAGDNFLATTLRMILAVFISKGKEKRFAISKKNPAITEEDLVKQAELTDAEVVDIIMSEIKKRKDAIALYEKGNRPELAENEQKEIQALKKYLPEQMSLEEVTKIAKEIIDKVGAKEMKDMGKVMAELNVQIKGKIEASEASKVVKDLLSK